MRDRKEYFRQRYLNRTPEEIKALNLKSLQNRRAAGIGPRKDISSKELDEKALKWLEVNR